MYGRRELPRRTRITRRKGKSERASPRRPRRSTKEGQGRKSFTAKARRTQRFRGGPERGMLSRSAKTLRGCYPAPQKRYGDVIPLRKNAAGMLSRGAIEVPLRSHFGPIEVRSSSGRAILEVRSSCNRGPMMRSRILQWSPRRREGETSRAVQKEDGSCLVPMGQETACLSAIIFKMFHAGEGYKLFVTNPANPVH
jgi:hypothetical protein